MRKYPDSCGNFGLDYGDYGLTRGTWYIRAPGQHITAVPSTHKVTEHDDNTITVVPQLHIDDWAGYLIRGEFTEVDG